MDYTTECKFIHLIVKRYIFMYFRTNMRDGHDEINELELIVTLATKTV